MATVLIRVREARSVRVRHARHPSSSPRIIEPFNLNPMPFRLALHAASLAALVCICGCREFSRLAPTSMLATVDSVTLAESDQIFVARATAFHPAADGSFAVADAGRGTVLEYTRTGALTREYGQRGRGPGEFGRIGSTVLLSATHLIANDGARKALLVFDRRTGSLVNEVQYAGRLGDSRLDGERAVLGLWDMERGTAGLRVAVGSLPHRRAGDSLVASLTPMPAQYVSSGALAGIYGLYVATVWGDSVAAVFAGDSTILLQPRPGQAGTTLAIPAQLRRGLPTDFVQLLESQDVPFPDKFKAASAALHVARLSTGDLAVVHYDSDLEGSAIRARLWLSVVSPAGRVRCIDREIPTSGDVRALVHVDRDTLFVLDQTVAAASLTTLVRVIPIAPAGC